MCIKPKSQKEDDSRREYILNIILVGSLALLIFFDAFVLYYSLQLGPKYVGVGFAMFSTIPTFFAFLLFLSRRGEFVVASYLLVVTYFVSTSYAAYHNIHTETALLAYVLTILMASILIDTRFGFLVTACASIFIVSAWYAQFHGWIPIHALVFNSSDAITYALLFLLIMTVAWLSNREIERSLLRARKSEQELIEERDMLEVTVETRTHELRKTQFEKVEQLYRFAEVGRLATGLFHDMLNVMSANSLRTEETALLGNERDREKADQSVRNAIEASHHINRFTQAIRTQLNQEESLELFRIENAVEEVIQLVSYRAAKEKVDVVFNRPEHSVRHYGDSFRLHQVILNLVLNAIDAYQEEPTIANPKQTVSIDIANIGNNAIVRIRDHGCGMTPDVQAKIFQPFFTTKSESKGIGIGLATAKKIVEETFGGTIAVRSVPGQGSVFTVSFPLSNAPSPNHHETPPSSPENP